MARIRTVKPDFFRHKRLYQAEKESGLPIRVAYAGLWTIADREGRFKWDPDSIKLDVLPWDQLDFAHVLHALATRGFIVAYEVDGTRYGVIPGFVRHQVINNRESKSVLPPPPTDLTKGLELQLDLTPVAHVHDTSPTRDDAASGEGKGREEEKEGKGMTRDASPAPWVGIIDAFDHTRAAIWGQARARPWKHPNDATDAKRFLDAGANVDLCRNVFGSVMNRMKAAGREPPDNLRYFQQPIADAIAGAKTPMPEARVNGNGQQSSTPLPSKDEIRELMKNRANTISRGIYLASVTVQDVSGMIKMGWLTKEDAVKAGYPL